jgi:hypothetical protein
MLTPERRWWYLQRSNMAVEALRRNRFEAAFFETREQAIDHILELVPSGSVIGFGDSLTLQEIRLYDALEKHGCKLVNPPSRQDHLPADEKRELRFGCFASDVYVCSANAITLDGRVVNIDGIGNRVAFTIYGPPKVILTHAWRDGYKVPCGHTGVCTDCRGPNRMCRVTVIHEGPTKQTATHVLIVGEELGL